MSVFLKKPSVDVTSGDSHYTFFECIHTVLFFSNQTNLSPRLYLKVEGVEVVVAVLLVHRSLAVKSRQCSLQDGHLLAAVVAHHADLQAHGSSLRGQRDGLELEELDGRRVEVEEAKVVDRVAVDGLHRDLLSVQEHGLCDNGTWQGMDEGLEGEG